MKINEIILESSKGKPTREVHKASTGEWLFRDEGVDRVYNLNRVMMASAMHDGKTDEAVDMPAASWVEKYNVARPYTEEEHRMVKGAFKTVGADHHHSIPDHRSREHDETHKASPVPHNAGAKRKKK